MNILVTGGAGFIGSNLVDSLLADGHNVFIVDNFNDYYHTQIKEQNIHDNLNNKNCTLCRCDICDINQIDKIFLSNKIDVVVHLSARVGVRQSLENPKDYIETNIIGTVNILEEMKKHNVKKLVFASSSSVYGNCQADVFTEDLKVAEPISPYGAAKSACEQIIYTYHHLYNINAVILRFFPVYGPRQHLDFAIYKFVDKIEKNEPIEMYGDGTTQCDYTFVDDIVSGIKSAITYNKTGYEIINLGGGESISLKGVIQTIEQVLGKSAIIKQKPMQRVDINKTVCDWSKAHRLLNYTPKTTFKQGIQKFVEWKRSRD